MAVQAQAAPAPAEALAALVASLPLLDVVVLFIQRHLAAAVVVVATRLELLAAQAQAAAAQVLQVLRLLTPPIRQVQAAALEAGLLTPAHPVVQVLVAVLQPVVLLLQVMQGALVNTVAQAVAARLVVTLHPAQAEVQYTAQAVAAQAEAQTAVTPQAQQAQAVQASRFLPAEAVLQELQDVQLELAAVLVLQLNLVKAVAAAELTAVVVLQGVTEVQAAHLAAEAAEAVQVLQAAATAAPVALEEFGL
jgi:hypothetical protein